MRWIMRTNQVSERLQHFQGIVHGHLRPAAPETLERFTKIIAAGNRALARLGDSAFYTPLTRALR